MSDLREQLQKTLGDAYTLERELGGGGMSRVFLAEERSLGRKVVVKVLPAEMAGQVSGERFKREIMLAARLQHPHIVPLHTAGESEGLPYFTMPFVHGESLRVRLARQGEFPVSEAIRLLREIATALSYAHEHGIVHRDIKPDNVLLSGGSAMVTDFGVAKALSASSNAEHGGATSLGIALGTPAYMSPEQATADPAIDHRADIYAFGVLAYELLTGQPPFAGRTPQNLLAAHVTETPEPIGKRRASLPPGLSALVMRCLEKRPADRMQSVTDIVHVLDGITTPSGGTAPTTAMAATGERGLSMPAQARRPRAIAGVVVALLVFVAGAGFVIRHGRSGGGAAPAMQTLAVLPFANGGDTASDYFSEGISDELRSELGRVQGVTVKARSIASQFQGHADDQSAVATRLGIELLLVGSIRTSGERVRITAELVRVADNASLWSAKYDRDRKTVIALQDSIAHQIAGALQARLADAHGTAANPTGTDNALAYDLYLRGRFLFDKRGEKALRAAIPLFQQATVADPQFARAFASLASALAVLPAWSNTPPDSIATAALAAADRAVALDSTLAEAFASRGNALSLGQRWPEIEAAFRRALQLDSHRGETMQWLGEIMNTVGRSAEAVKLTTAGAELDPYLGVRWNALASAQISARQMEDAVLSLRRGLEVDPGLYANRLDLAAVLARLGRSADALHEMELVPEAGLTAPERGEKAFVFFRTGRLAEAEAITRQLERDESTAPSFTTALAAAYIGRGDRDRAISALIRALDRKDTAYWFLSYPEFDTLRSHPRWPELLRRMRLENEPLATMKPAR